MRIRIDSLTIAGAGIALAGVAILTAAAGIKTGFSYDSVGPATLPRFIGGGLILAGVLVLIENRGAERAEEVSFGRALPVIVISAALLGLALLVRLLGWVPMAATVFLAGAFAFGSRHVLRDAIIGIGVGLVTLGLFRFGLGLNLPIGTLFGG